MNSLAPSPIRAVFLAVFSSYLLPDSLFAQGSVTPPGAPAPTMKTLTEVEPRIAVQTLNGDFTAQFLISQAGSYYLTGNINGVSGKAAVAINADNVTLDLGGHALIGVSGATRGVELRGTRSQIVVRHGSIRTFDTGGVTSTGTVTNARVEGISILGIINGDGIAITGDGTHVRDCELTSIGGSGIRTSGSSGIVENCAVQGCSDAQPVSGISSGTVVSCAVLNIASTGSSAVGISAKVANNCSVTAVTGASNSSGIFSSEAAGCNISLIGSIVGAAGSATGLNTHSAATCTITSVGFQGSTSAPVGISGTSLINCEVDHVGDTGSAVGATGISTPADGAVSNCRVTAIRGGSSGTVTGITAGVVSGSTVGSMTQGASSGSMTGITADVITACNLATINGSTTATVSGIDATSLVRDCTISTVINSGAGSAVGLLNSSGIAGSVENCIFRSCGDIGISVTARQRIIGCTISTASTGINATSTRNVIDGNNIENCITGIKAVSGTNTANALIVRNQIRICSTNLAFDAPCQVGPIVTTTGFISSTNPWANFTD